MFQTRFPRAILLASLSTLTLAACGGSSHTVDANKTAAPMPPITEMDAAMNAPAPMPLSSTDTLTPVMPAATAAPVVAPAAAGLTMEERMAKLEASVNSLRTDYDRIMPAFASLNTTNERIQVLLDEMEAQGSVPAAAAAKRADAPAAAPAPVVSSTTTTITTQTTEEAPVVAAPKTAMKTTPTKEEVIVDKTEQTTTTVTTATPVEEKAPAASTAAANTVTAVRIGEHGSKTRLVFDLSSKAKPEFKYDLDNTEHLLLVDMPSSAWNAKDTGAPNSPLISSWSAQKSDAGGSSVAIQLKKNARILSTEFLKAEGKDPARLVMDIAAGG
jgi:hypothetical protein